METPELAFKVMRELSRGRPCDFTGIIDYKMIDRRGGIQWPLPLSTPSNFAHERRLFEDGNFYHPDHKAKFLFDAPRPVAEPVTSAFPFVLMTGRGSSAQWHTNTRTGKSAILRKLYPKDSLVEIHQDDASGLKLAAGDWVFVKSLRGQARARTTIASTVSPGQLFMPMHDVEVNKLTFPSFDPHSRQPSYKYCAVKLVKDPDQR